MGIVCIIVPDEMFTGEVILDGKKGRLVDLKVAITALKIFARQMF